MPVASTVVANSTAQPSIQSQNLPKHVSEQMQHIHPLANRFTSVEVQGISEPTHIKQELQEIERQQLSCNRYLQTSSRPTNMGDPVQTHFSHNNEASHRRFSQTEHQHFLNLQHHLSPADGYNQRSPPEPQKFQLNGAVSHPVSSHIQQSNTNMWKIPGRGAPPQAFPEPSRPGINAPTSLQQTIQFHVNKPRGNVPSEENLGTKNKYVQKASEVADEAKLAHRALLKDAQRNKEMDAEARGEPLSAKDKERERSRRESAVTRKRAEIYIQELERTARNVPELESTIQHLYSECQRLGQLCGMRSPDGNHSLPKAPLLSAISVFPSPEGAKSEPGMVESPNTSSATRVVSELKELDL